MQPPPARSRSLRPPGADEISGWGLMTRKEDDRQRLGVLKVWDSLLLRNSGLPGPRGNIELAQAVAEEGSPALFLRFLANDPTSAPANSPREFLAFCGVLGLGRLLAEGRRDSLKTLRLFASDPRWRVREAVVMALQRYGDEDMLSLLAEMRLWAAGGRLEQRAAAAALCEPRLLHEPHHASATLEILDTITRSMEGATDRRTEAFVVLRKGLGTCWSVAAAALPSEGLARMERWIRCTDSDIRWIMKENLKKQRLVVSDPAWVRKWSRRMRSA